MGRVFAREKMTPWKINGWNLQITHLERKMIFQISMIMFHVKLQGCNLNSTGLGHHPTDEKLRVKQFVSVFFEVWS